MDYFNGPAILQTMCAVGMVFLAFAARDKSKSLLLPCFALALGLIAIGGVVWAGATAARQRKQDQQYILSAAAPLVQHILSFSEEQFSIMAISAGEMELGSTKEPSAEQIFRVLSRLQPTGASNMHSINECRRLNWLEFMHQYNLKTIQRIDELYQYMQSLDPELVAALGELRNCYHFKEIQLLASRPPVGNHTLAFVPFDEYQKKLARVRRYYVNNLKAYGGRTPHSGVIPFIPQQMKTSNKALHSTR